MAKHGAIILPMLKFVENNPLLLRDWRELRRHWYRHPFVWMVLATAAIQSVVAIGGDRLLGSRGTEFVFTVEWGLTEMLLLCALPIGAAFMPRSRKVTPLIQECLTSPLPHRAIFWWLFLRIFNSVCVVLLAGYLPLLIRLSLEESGSAYLSAGVVWLLLVGLLFWAGLLRPMARMWLGIALALALAVGLVHFQPWSARHPWPWWGPSHICICISWIGFVVVVGAWPRLSQHFRASTLLGAFLFLGVGIVMSAYSPKTDRSAWVSIPHKLFQSFPPGFILTRIWISPAFSCALGIAVGLHYPRSRGLHYLLSFLIVVEFLLMPMIYILCWELLSYSTWRLGSLHIDWRWFPLQVHASDFGLLWLGVKWGLVQHLSQVRIATE